MRHATHRADRSRPETDIRLVASGGKHTALNGEVYRYGAGECLVTTVDLPLVGSIVAADSDEPFLAMSFQLNADRIASLGLLLDTGVPASVASACNASGMTAAHSPSAFGVGQAPPLLLDATARLLALLEQPDDI